MYTNHNKEISSFEVALVERHFASAVKSEEQRGGIRLSPHFSERFWRNFHADDPFYARAQPLTNDCRPSKSIKAAYDELDLLMEVCNPSLDGPS